MLINLCCDALACWKIRFLVPLIGNFAFIYTLKTLKKSPAQRLTMKLLIIKIYE